MLRQHDPLVHGSDIYGVMGFLDRAAMKAEQRRLTPFFLPDERFIQTDVCELLAIEFQPEGRRVPGGQVAFTLTNKAVYFRKTKERNADVIRVPYERIVTVVATGDMLEFTTFSGGDYLFRNIGRPMGDDKHVVIAAELKRRENHRQVIDLPDGSHAEVVNRARDEDVVPEWFTIGDVDRTDPANQRAIEAAAASAIARLGPFRWPETS